MLSIAERRKYILDSLNRHGFVRVADMAAEMNVTKATVRKDMEFLESRNLLYRTHGSASPVNPLVQDVSVHVKSAVNSEIKQKIAVEAAGLICPDDSVFIASGSTVYAFAERIRPVGHLNVVTPSLRVAMLMNESEETTVTVLGGVLYKKSLSVRGEYAAQGFENVICSKLFFGVDGMDGILTMEGFDPKLAEGVMLLTPFNADATDDKTASFVKKYKEQFGETPNQFAADAYDCVYAYKQALENAGATPDMSAEDLCDKMIEQFTSMTFDGLTGEGMTWDETGAVSKSPKGMVIENGAYVGM